MVDDFIFTTIGRSIYRSRKTVQRRNGRGDVIHQIELFFAKLDRSYVLVQLECHFAGYSSGTTKITLSNCSLEMVFKIYTFTLVQF